MPSCACRRRRCCAAWATRSPTRARSSSATSPKGASPRVSRSVNAPAPQLSQLETTPVRLRALDGYELAGTYHAAKPDVAVRRVALVHSGAGIAAGAYRRFAGYLAQAGIPALTYNYRGIGGSRPRALRGFRAAIEDWSEYDCGGAIAWLRAQF